MTNNNVTIIDQQPHFIVVDKPADMSFHDDENKIGFFNHVKNTLALPDLFPVHRLDKMTSGLLILATSLAAAREFQRQFTDKEIEKYYLAISDKKPTKKQGLIKGDMAKSRRGMWKLLRRFKNPAISQFFSTSIGAGKRLFIVKPHTGKTHQIRVALASIGASILGDEYYSQSSSDRGYLHAFALRFTYNGESFQYVLAPQYGDQFVCSSVKKELELLQEPWLLNWPKL